MTFGEFVIRALAIAVLFIAFAWMLHELRASYEASLSEQREDLRRERDTLNRAWRLLREAQLRSKMMGVSSAELTAHQTNRYGNRGDAA